MEVDFEKVFRVGVDKITLYGFEIKTEEKKTIVEKNDTISEEFKKNIYGMELTSKYILNNDLTTKTLTFLSFNPNKILNEYNIENAREKELKEALDIVKKIWEKHNVFINFENVKVKDIEINKNFEIDFREYWDVFKLFFLKIKKNKGTYHLKDEELLEKMREDESFYYERVNKNTREITFKIRIYDKTKQVSDVYNKEISKKITRIEFFFNISHLLVYFKNRNLETNFSNLVNNIEIIDEIFQNNCFTHFLKKTTKTLENRKALLEREYLYFKESNKLARKTRKKQEYNVYKHLLKYWVFDKLFVIDIIKKYDKAHKGQEIKKINKYLSHCENLKKFSYLADDFLSLNFLKLSDKEKVTKLLKPFVKTSYQEEVTNKQTNKNLL